MEFSVSIWEEKRCNFSAESAVIICCMPSVLNTSKVQDSIPQSVTASVLSQFGAHKRCAPDTVASSEMSDGKEDERPVNCGPRQGSPMNRCCYSCCEP